MNNKSLCVIPARLGSSRFPGKPLKKICGKEMIAYCYENATNSESFDFVCIATPDDEIIEYCLANKFNVIKTSDTHERCTSRTLEALQLIESEHSSEYSNIVMLQGDEPLISKDMLKDCLLALQDNDVVNLATRVQSEAEHQDINEVKVVIRSNNTAIYFSRAKVPSTKDNLKIHAFKQVCAIGFSKEKLELFENLSPSEHEIYESVDMNRFVDNGVEIAIVKVDGHIASVDTIEDLKKVENIIKKNER